jgi:hypothetical protein
VDDERTSGGNGPATAEASEIVTLRIEAAGKAPCRAGSNVICAIAIIVTIAQQPADFTGVVGLAGRTAPGPGPVRYALWVCVSW